MFANDRSWLSDAMPLHNYLYCFAGDPYFQFFLFYEIECIKTECSSYRFSRVVFCGTHTIWYTYNQYATWLYGSTPVCEVSRSCSVNKWRYPCDRDSVDANNLDSMQYFPPCWHCLFVIVDQNRSWLLFVSWALQRDFPPFERFVSTLLQASARTTHLFFFFQSLLFIGSLYKVTIQQSYRWFRECYRENWQCSRILLAKPDQLDRAPVPYLSVKIVNDSTCGEVRSAVCRKFPWKAHQRRMMKPNIDS